MSDPAAWLVDNVDLIPAGGLVLDVASGSGRNARYLAERGWRVHAVDRDPAALDRLRSAAIHAATGRITTEVIDLELGPVALGTARYDAVIVFNYLHRPLVPALVRALKSGGVLIYETFTTPQADRGKPRNPAFLLTPGELPLLVAPLRVVRAREGEFESKFVASIVAMS